MTIFYAEIVRHLMNFIFKRPEGAWLLISKSHFSIRHLEGGSSKFTQASNIIIIWINYVICIIDLPGQCNHIKSK